MEFTDGKIKVSGDAKELVELLKNIDFDSDTIQSKKQSNISLVLFIVFSALYIIVSCIFWLLYTKLQSYDGVLFIVLAAILGGVILLFYLHFKNGIATSICAVVGIVILLISMHVMTPNEAGKDIKEKTDKALNTRFNTQQNDSTK